MSRSGKEGVLSRWSRRKLESMRANGETGESAERVAANLESVTEGAGEASPPERESETLAELPPLDELGPDSDFQGFMNPDVDDGLRRAALKKLFSDPQFNVTDGLDVYAEDYTKLESMTPAMVAGLKHAQRLLFGDVEGDKQTDIARQPETSEGAEDKKTAEEAALPGHGENRERGDDEDGNGEAEIHAELMPDKPKAGQ